MVTSDHVPCLVSINIAFQSHIFFHFENYWVDHEDFLDQVKAGWVTSVHHTDATKIVTAKFKNLRRTLKAWSRILSNLKENISRVKLILDF